MDIIQHKKRACMKRVMSVIEAKEVAIAKSCGVPFFLTILLKTKGDIKTY